MTTSLLYERAIAQLLLDKKIGLEVQNVIGAAFDSDAAIEAGLRAKTAQLAAPAPRQPIELPSTFLGSLEVAGFRGIGNTAKIELSPHPGLTILVGRNGSGKSSFADAFEVMLTGESTRFRGKGNEWLRGWRNVHSTTGPKISAAYHVSTKAVPIYVSREWADHDVSNSTLKVLQADEVYDDYDNLGWLDAVEAFRPVLSYDDLGVTHQGPASLYNDLDKILGLDQLAVVKGRLARVREAREVFQREVDIAKEALSAVCRDSNDERIGCIVEVLEAPVLDSDALEALLEKECAECPRVRTLIALADLWAPRPEEVAEVARALQTALELVEELRLTQIGSEAATLDVLKRTVEFYQDHHEPKCPACGTETLSDDWYSAARGRVEALTLATKAYQDAEAGLKTAIRAAQTLMDHCIIPASDGGLETYSAGAAAAKSCSQAPSDPRELPAHILKYGPVIDVAFSAIRNEAEQALSEINSNWRPVRSAIRALLVANQRYSNVQNEIETLKAAEKWIREFESEVRSERFKPILERTQQIWSELRDQPNVTLNAVDTTGDAPRPRMEFNVSVDGMVASSLRMMSQGELHSLLLSLFLPRLTSPESPFRFIIIDDPAHAMDSAKIDGLARVLERKAKTHQVIILTHDTRLADAVRRLRIPTEFLSVVRHERSEVTIAPGKTPARQFMDDALDLLNHKNEMASEITRRVIPGLCRAAFEIAFREMAWRTLLDEGVSHEVCEVKIESAKQTREIVDLAVFGTHEPGNAYDVLDERFDMRVVNPLRLAIKYAHQPYKGSLYELVELTKSALKAMDAL